MSFRGGVNACVCVARRRARFCAVSLCFVAVLMSSTIVGCGGTTSFPATSAPQPATAGQPVELTVSAASSLQDVLTEIQASYSKRHPEITLLFNLGASNQLQFQIEQGAPTDVFLSAAEAQMDSLESKGLLAAGTRRDFATNKLVLIVPAKSALGLSSFNDLARTEMKRIGIGGAGVPAGDYARQVLTSLGLWGKLQERLVYGGTVRQVLTYVEQGNIDAGLVYATDAATTSGVSVVAQVPADIAPAIRYPGAAIATSRHPAEAADFVTYLTEPEAQTIFRKYGFLAP